MKHSYYSLPLKLGSIIHKKKLVRCNLDHSISGHIHLMLTSRFKENKYDYNFGNSIWENEFGNISKDNIAREDIKRSIIRCITRYEPRLDQVQVDMRWLQEEVGVENMKRLNKRLDIKISGVIAANKRPFIHNEQFYIAPLSYK